ncbi:MAG TPA: glycosyltransferase family 2 protein [Gemmatimonadaceae bacterium]|nr:glycosyltransferase family 2 protein [Gemmatimonadaceae bacterium]
MPGVALLWLAATTALGVFIILILFARGARSIPNLADQAPRTDGPLVSVVFAARDEGANIEATVTSLLGQTYERLEIVAVNDRSVDDTGSVMERMATRDPRIRVLHVTELPPGWLGKNHALDAGAALAGGEYLLFTDADIIFDREAVARAVAFVESRDVDHLTLGPELESPTPMLALVVNFFSLGFLLLFRPWLAHHPERQEHMGVGAFNLVRTSLYRGFGGHSRIALRPDDDIKLGRLVKLARGRQMVAGGMGVIRVRWYSTVRELAHGLRKNTFAGLNYSLPYAIGAVVIQYVVNVWPFVAVLVTSGPTRWLNLATALMLMAMYAAVAAGSRSKAWLAFGYPLAAVIFSWIIMSATWLTIRRGGIEWRGTFYRLAELKANRV